MAVKIITEKGILYSFIDDYVKRNGLTIDELATIIGKSPTQTSNIKNGKITSLSLGVLTSLCEYFNCQPGQLLQYQNVSEDNIKSINEVRLVHSISSIKNKSLNNKIEVELHIIFYREDDAILYGSPEVDLFSDFELIDQDIDEIELRQLVLEDFVRKIKIKKTKYKNIDHFIIEMQKLNHWYFDVELNYFVPMSLDYYRRNYSVIPRMINKPNAKIIKTKIFIQLTGEQIEFNN